MSTLNDPHSLVSHPGSSTAVFDRRTLLCRAARLTVGGMALSGAGGLLLESAGPADAHQLSKMPSVDEQKKVGREAARKILGQYHEVFDERADAFRDMGRRLVSALPPEDQKWDFDFHVLHDKTVNAFALPGGPMFLFTGLYELLSSLDAMAAVTGHEMTHVRKEHWARAYQQAQNRKLAMTGLSILLHGNVAVQSLAGMANNAIGLKYSRGEEDQADAGGLENMVNAGFNPQGMVQLFEVLQKVSGNGGGTAGDFLSDHPLTSDRIKHTKERIAAYGDRTFPPLTPLIGSPAAPVPPVTPPPPAAPPAPPFTR